MVIDLVILLLFPALMAFAAASDLLTMTISNRVSIILVGGFLVVAVASGMAPMEILSHAGAAALVLVVSFGLFACGWIGGGDAKLASATALWLGFALLFNYFVYASLLGGALTLLLILFRLAPLPGLLAGQHWARQLHREDGAIPYGIALAVAALVVYPDIPWMKAVGL